MSSTWSFILVAAGAGNRLGGTPKQFRLLGGIPLWQWSCNIAEKLLSAGVISEIILVLPEKYEYELIKNRVNDNIKIIKGGKSRAESVYNALNVSVCSDVLIHDAARPFLTEKLCLELINKAEKTGASVPLLKVKDSVKKIANEKMSVVERENLYLTQTPQLFSKDELLEMLGKTELKNTDEASVWIEMGKNISYVTGDESNFKITTQYDWDRAEMIVNANKIIRIGHGYDIHKLVEGRNLILGGLKIEDSPIGLFGHSDADVVTHTVMDALLGAAGEPDIGRLFPASDNTYKNISSILLFEKVLEKLKNKGWQIEWIDVTLIAQTPKLGHLVDKIADNLNKYLSDSTDKLINLKVKSGEECGSVGRSECMICHAVATIFKNN